MLATMSAAPCLAPEGARPCRGLGVPSWAMVACSLHARITKAASALALLCVHFRVVFGIP